MRCLSSLLALAFVLHSSAFGDDTLPLIAPGDTTLFGTQADASFAPASLRNQSIYRADTAPSYLLIMVDTASGRIFGEVRSLFSSIRLGEIVRGLKVADKAVFLRFYSKSDVAALTEKVSAANTAGAYSLSSWIDSNIEQLEPTASSLFLWSPTQSASAQGVWEAQGGDDRELPFAAFRLVTGLDGAINSRLESPQSLGMIEEYLTGSAVNETIVRYAGGNRYISTKILDLFDDLIFSALEVAGLPSAMTDLSGAHDCTDLADRVRSALENAGDWDVARFDWHDGDTLDVELTSHSDRWYFYNKNQWWMALLEISFDSNLNDGLCNKIRYQIYDSAVCARPITDNPFESGDRGCFRRVDIGSSAEYELREQIGRKLITEFVSGAH